MCFSALYNFCSCKACSSSSSVMYLQEVYEINTHVIQYQEHMCLRYVLIIISGAQLTHCFPCRSIGMKYRGAFPVPFVHVYHCSEIVTNSSWSIDPRHLVISSVPNSEQNL